VPFSANFLFLLAWVAIAFFVLRYLAVRYLEFDARKANAVAGAVAAAFLIGLLWPGAHRGDTAPAGGGAPAANGAGAAGPAPDLAGTTEVSGRCGKAVSPALGGGVGNFDALVGGGEKNIGDGGTLSSGVRYDIQGWATNRTSDGPAPGICVIVDDRVSTLAVRYGVARPDVVSYFHNGALAKTGFDVPLPPGSLPAGSHKLQMAMEAQDGRLYGFGLARTVSVR
jgi:hypothetical protein